MEFRTASLSDLSDIAALFHACWHISYKDLLSAEVRSEMTLDNSADLWRPSLIDPKGKETVVGILDSKIASVFRIGEDKDDSTLGHLFSLYVDPKVAGKGLGKASLNMAAEKLAEKGFKSMSLWVFEKNAIARNLYQGFGFQLTGESRVDERWKENEVKMRKEFT
ncbi:MAG: GNAT family N-acetyltransferase [Candidatus Nanopelagicaceae bacterium]|nr:GNAT family N-acetyltransferase [Candidatus Nanopelagicaceae bacterium]